MKLGIRQHYALLALSVANFFFYADRYILFILVEPIKQEFSLSDGQMGLLTGVAFAVTYCLFAVPLGRHADHSARVPMIALALLAWSIATAVFSVAKSYIQLLALRSFVAIGEAAGYVATQSLVGDLYKPEHRARALAVVYGIGTLGMVFAYTAVGAFSDSFGWRSGFLFLGLLGLLLGPVFYLTVREPRRGASEGLEGQKGKTPIGLAASELWQRKSFVFMVAGYMAASIASFSVIAWLPAYFIRRFDLSIAMTGLLTSLGSIGPMLVGMLVAGVVSTYLYRRDPRWVIRLPVIGMVMAAVFLALQVTTSHLTLAILFGAIPAFVSGVYIPPLMAAMQNIAGVRLRGTAAAITALATMLMGQGVGPALVGILSDLFSTGDPEQTFQSLQQALLSVSSLFLLTALLLSLSMRFFSIDVQAARKFDERHISRHC